MNKESIAVFNALKTYAIHEDNLMNYRMNWCLGISSVMFTSLALLVGSIDKLPKIFGVSVLLPIMVFEALLGMLVAFVSFLGVRAAESALGSLNEIWADEATRSGATDFPCLLGGIQLSRKLSMDQLVEEKREAKRLEVEKRRAERHAAATQRARPAWWPAPRRPRPVRYGSGEEWYTGSVWAGFLGFPSLLVRRALRDDHNEVGRHYPTILISAIWWAWLVILLTSWCVLLLEPPVAAPCAPYAWNPFAALFSPSPPTCAGG